jgi:peptidoglycan-associated lipoprotein
VREREQREAARASADSILRATVYFDYDQSTLTDAAQALLTAKVPVLQARSGIRIRITGHTDSRGSAEYNLALGLRRASETKAFLVANGIDASRIDIFSLGEERPAMEGESEDVWSKNRRAEFQVLNGGDN